jgi:Uncharacterized conserved protein
MTVGVAILDLSGEILSVNSCKEVSRSEITKHIISFGKTVLVATDVHQPPKMVKKMAATLNSKIYAPYRDLAVNAKNEMVDDYLHQNDNRPLPRRSRDVELVSVPKNAHERDALAAAIQGYKKYQKKLEQIERRARDLEIPLDMVDDVKIMVINEVPITKALNATLKTIKHHNIAHDTNEVGSIEDTPENGDISGTSSVPSVENGSEIISGLKNKLKSQQNQIRNLQKENSIMGNDIQKYQDEISQLENKIERLQYEYSQNILHQKEIATKKAIIRGLQEKYNYEKGLRHELEDQLGSIKRIRAMELSREASPVKIIESFSKDAIREATGSWNIKKGDVVLLKSSEGGGSQTAFLLVGLGVKAVLTTDKMSHQAKEEFEKHMVPLIELDRVDLEMAGDFAVIRSRDLEREVAQWKQNQEERKKKEDQNKLLKIMDDYRAQRKRSNHNF